MATMKSVTIKENLAKDDIRFEDVYKKAVDIESNREDFIIRNVATNMWMNEEDGSMSFRHRARGIEEVSTMNTTSWALSQLSVKLGMPSGYAEKCIERKHPDLAAQNINTWLTEQNGNKRRYTTDYLVRSYNDKIDGILSSNYTAFDTTKILDTVKKAINVDDYHVVGSYISDERMHLRLIRDNTIDADGEDLYPGIFIDSSDVGRTSLNVNFGIWKKVCTNGLCINKVGGVLYHQRHMGIESIDVERELIARVKMIPDLIARSEEIIKKAKSEKIDLHDDKVFEKMVSDIRRLTNVNEDIAKQILSVAQANYSSTRWGIVNGMTEIAQNFELDDRIRIENAAGRLITMA